MSNYEAGHVTDYCEILVRVSARDWSWVCVTLPPIAGIQQGLLQEFQPEPWWDWFGPYLLRPVGLEFQDA